MPHAAPMTNTTPKHPPAHTRWPGPAQPIWWPHLNVGLRRQIGQMLAELLRTNAGHVRRMWKTSPTNITAIVVLPGLTPAVVAVLIRHNDNQISCAQILGHPHLQLQRNPALLQTLHH